MRAVFVELPAFERYRDDSMSDQTLRDLQRQLLVAPEAGVLIPGAGGLRKLRVRGRRRGKGKRGGLRVLYYWWQAGSQCWLFTVYGKDEVSDLSALQLRAFRAALMVELAARRIR